MKKHFSILVFVILFVSMISCSSVITTTSSDNSGRPPGQVKKETGSQSAKPYAPGQAKKSTGSQSAAPYAPGQQKKKK